MTLDHPDDQSPDSPNVPPLPPTPLSAKISVKETKSLIDSGSAMILVDCREPHEFAHCHIESAVLMPMDSLPERVGELEEYRQHRIVVHCHHGGRSLRVVNWLRNHGFDTAQNMTGGIESWSLEVDPSVPRY